MKNCLRYFSLCIAFLLFSMMGTAQEMNTQGRDFWVSFMPNWPDSIPKLELLVACQNPCTGKVTNPHTGWSTSFSVSPGVVTSVPIPNSEGLMEQRNTIEHKALHVTTTDDVSLYASNFVIWSYDVANVLPTAILKDHYIVQSYDVSSLAQHSLQHLTSRMLIVATENNTEITIDPSGGLEGFVSMFSKQNITLNAGDCYMCISATGDISGTAVIVKNGKKVAVFSGGDTQIPFDGCCFDAVFEQCVPSAYWGCHFVVTASSMRDNDLVRITSLAPGCRISINGRHRKTLGARKSYDYKLVSKKDEAVYISASSPVCVCVYLTSASLGGIMGDPSMVFVNPIEQQMDKVTFCSYNTLKTRYHFVNIVSQTNQTAGITLDGKSIASEFKVVPKKDELSYARISINNGSHTLEAKNGGFVAHIYGLGEYESYAYSIGSSSRVLNQFDDQGNLILSNISDDDDEDASDTLGIEDDVVKPYLRTDTLPTVEFDGITLTQLKNGGEVIGVIDTIIDPELFDITVEADNPYLFEDIEMKRIKGDTIVLGLHTHEKWCDCFVPKRLRANVVLTPKDNKGGDSRILIPTMTPIAKDRSWIGRCFWVLVALLALFFAFFYIWAMLKKRRFKKDAVMNPVYYDRNGDEVDNHSGTPLREEGLWAWLKRWFWPRDERHTLSFDSPSMSPLTFVAADTDSTIYIVKSDIDAQTMSIDGYDPNNDRSESKYVKLAANGKIVVTKRDGITPDGYVSYSPGEIRDGGLYRLLLSIVLIVVVLAIVVLVFLIVRGLK